MSDVNNTQREKYIEISSDDDKIFYLKPIDGWSTIIKSTHTLARNNRALGKCIKYWKKEGFKVFKFV